MRKAPCITADQSRMQETHTNHHGRPVHTVYRIPHRKARRKFAMSSKKTENELQEAIRLILEMNDEQIKLVVEAFNILQEDETKTPEECVMLARERLSKEEKTE